MTYSFSPLDEYIFKYEKCCSYSELKYLVYKDLEMTQNDIKASREVVHFLKIFMAYLYNPKLDFIPLGIDTIESGFNVDIHKSTLYGWMKNIRIKLCHGKDILL